MADPVPLSGALTGEMEAYFARAGLQLDGNCAGLSRYGQKWRQTAALLEDLTPEEADEVLGLLRRSADAGELSVLMITHKLREIFAYAKTATVLRRGRVTGGGLVSVEPAAEVPVRLVASGPGRGAGFDHHSGGRCDGCRRTFRP